MKSSKEANAVRILAMDGVQKANSGHPGAPMGMADMAEVLWRRNLKHNPANPNWFDRDRFVLSNGHASMLIYSLLHLTGYDLSLEDLKNFRQLGSKTPGHPEYSEVPGVDTTTGPLGQGITNAVGMALAEKILAAKYNKADFPIVDHYTYSFMGDGCMMEGISHEAASFAGTHKLGKLVAFYDDNGISIDGEVEGWFTDDTGKRFEAYGWQVIGPVDGHDGAALQKALEEAKKVSDKPSLIICKTTIGFGSPNKSGKEESHGAPLGVDECILTRKELGWENEELFHVPEDLYKAWDAREKGAAAEAEWNTLFESYAKAYPAEAAEFTARMEGKLPKGWEETYNSYVKGLMTDAKAIASRKASQISLGEIGALIPQLIGGSADLAPSNLTTWSGSKSITPEDADGNYIHFGVREFAMTALENGMALHGGFLAYNATFLIFKDYAQNAIRMAALMKQQSILIYTHDSIGVGEDGPTHQPVEQIPTLRLMPGVHTWRPADWLETAVAWREAVKYTQGPSALTLSRQNLEPLARTDAQVEAVAKGGYTLVDCDGTPDMILIATGSEVKLCVDAAEELAGKGKKVRVVSIPCTEIFDAQDKSYKESVLPPSVTKRHAYSLGDGLRPGCLADASDDAQFAELDILGELVQRARSAGVQVMVEGPGHVPYDQIQMNMERQIKVCDGAPFYVLGPIVSDAFPGYDHITSTIGATAAAYHGASFLCYVTPAEHLGLPTAEDVKAGCIAYRIAAHAADVALKLPGAQDWDDRISKARSEFDWPGVYKEAFDTETAKEIKSRTGGPDEDYCSMCGKEWCAVRISRELS